MCLFLACCSWQMWIMGSTALTLPSPFSTWVIGCLTSWITVRASCVCSSGCFSSQRLDLCFISSLPDVCDPNPCFNGGSCQMKSGGEFECLCLGPYSGKRCQKGQEIHRKGVMDKRYFSFDGSDVFPVKNHCENVRCGYGDCVNLKSHPYYECKCKPPFQGPNCMTRESAAIVTCL